MAYHAHAFVAPKRELMSMVDMRKWIQSEAYFDYRGFLINLNQAVTGKASTDACDESESIQKFCDLLAELHRYVDEIPPVEQPQRFGNQAFRDWHKRLTETADELLTEMLTSEQAGAIIELKPYLLDSFGNATRIDYGTGHEAAFLMLLCCLTKIGFFQSKDMVAVVNRAFDRYLKLCRRLQQTYRMEPAGSHGVYGLDDYQFISFYLGSAQLIGKNLEPNSFLNENIVSQNSEQFMFMGCIKYINEVKVGPFFEHSNQLYNISGVPSWSKINTGLMKMYETEVLAKFPIVQHFLFGSLLSIKALDTSVSSVSITLSGKSQVSAVQ